MTDFIFISDLHLRDDVPICRTDNYLEAQEEKLIFITNAALKYKCPLVIAGDLGHRPNWSFQLLNLFIKIISKLEYETIFTFAIPGQHDLYGKEEKDLDSTAFGILFNSGIVKSPGLNIIPFGKFGELTASHNRKIGVIHKMIIKNNPLWPGQSADRAKEILKRNPKYDIIVSGDNHKTFICGYKNRILINCGSVMRMKSDQMDHEPRIFLYNSKNNSIKTKFIPIKRDVITRKHIIEKRKRLERIEIIENKHKENKHLRGYITELKGNKFRSISYKKNMNNYLLNTKVRKRVKTIISESMEKGR